VTLIYILCAPQAYEAALELGRYESESLPTEGFIHASPANQLTRVANKYYRHYPSLQLLTVEADKITAPVKWEAISNGDLYPHIYGPLNMDAVSNVQTVERSPDGTYQIASP